MNSNRKFPYTLFSSYNRKVSFLTESSYLLAFADFTKNSQKSKSFRRINFHVFCQNSFHIFFVSQNLQDIICQEFITARSIISQHFLQPPLSPLVSSLQKATLQRQAIIPNYLLTVWFQFSWKISTHGDIPVPIRSIFSFPFTYVIAHFFYYDNDIEALHYSIEISFIYWWNFFCFAFHRT